MQFPRSDPPPAAEVPLPSAALDRLDAQLTRWMSRYGVALLRCSLGAVFLWFGVLKFFPGLSPAENLAARTVDVLAFGWVPTRTALAILAGWECLIGLGLILGFYLRVTLLLLWLQMVGALAPLFLFPGEMFTRVPYAPTLEGQYIIKNVVLISAGLVVGATVRRGGDVPTRASGRLQGQDEKTAQATEAR